MPVRARLAAAVAAATAILIIAAGLIFVHQLRRGLEDALDTTLRTRAEALIQQLGADGTGFQDAGADGLLPPNQALAQVIGRTGALLDASEGAADQQLLNRAQLLQARVGSVSTTVTSSLGNVRLLAVPIPGSGRPPVVVVVATTTELVEQAVSRVSTALLLGGPAGVLLSGAGTWLLAGAALRPVERMRRQTEAITAGQLHARLSVPATRDEVARLGATMNALLHRLQQSLSRQRDFVADAGHELRTPLSYLRTELELAARPGRSYPELQAAVARGAGDVDRLIRLAEDLLLLARADHSDIVLNRSAVHLGRLVTEVAAAARPRAAAAGVHLDLDNASDVTVAADPDRLRQMVDNLVDNALRVSPSDSTVTIHTGLASTPDCAVIEVRDHGPGFPPDFLPHAFERFRRADVSRSPGDGGTGLGLAIVASLAWAHGGAVHAENAAGGGATVQIRLPVGRPADPPLPPHLGRSELLAGRHQHDVHKM